MKKFAIKVSLIFSLACALVYCGLKEDEDPLPNLHALYAAPLAITDYFAPKDDFYVVNFFASWCKSCVSELQNLIKIKEQTGTNFYGIALNDFSENVSYMLGDDLNPYKKIALDFDINSIKEVNLQKIPRILIIYKGDVVYDYEGEINSRILDKKIFPIINRIKQNLRD